MSEPSEKDTGTEDSPSLRVECYAGHCADTEPRRLRIGRREVLVAEIIDRWLDPRHRYFKLRGDDGATALGRIRKGTSAIFDALRRDDIDFDSLTVFIGIVADQVTELRKERFEDRLD